MMCTTVFTTIPSLWIYIIGEYYVCTFAWEHHVKIYNLYRKSFLPLLNTKDEGCLLDLGCGSGALELPHHVFSSLNGPPTE